MEGRTRRERREIKKRKIEGWKEGGRERKEEMKEEKN